MSSCCHTPEPEPQPRSGCCGPEDGEAQKAPFDWLLWGSLALCVLAYGYYALAPVGPKWLVHLGHGVFELLNTMWWGVLIGMVFVGLLHFVPQQLVVSLLGRGNSLNGILRATAAGVLLDLCNHGILMVGMKLYQKGASLGQTVAFLIASPWNSLSLTLIMIALIGLPWTIAFIVLSMVIAVIAGLIFDELVAKRKLNGNDATDHNASADAPPIKQQIKTLFKDTHWHVGGVVTILKGGITGSRMVLRWLLFGVLLAAAIRAFVPTEAFAEWFGPSMMGLLLTAIAATIIEVCSEGSTPIAADLMNRARAPGNSFMFLMAGVATDYTEIMVIKDTMKSWKTALYLPLVTLPQVAVVAILLNQLGG